MAAENKNNERTWTIACIDGSQFNSAVCDYAVWLSRVLAAPFKAVYAIEHATTTAAADLTGAIGLGAQELLLSELTELEQQRNKLEMQKGRQMLETVKLRATEAGIENPVTVQRHGSITETLLDFEHETRVVVVGIRGEQHEEATDHLGAHLETLVRSIQRPILVVNKEFAEPKAAMIAYDGSACSDKALEMVASSPMFNDIPVHLVYVAKEKGQGAEIIEKAKQKLVSAGRKVYAGVLEGDAAKALCQYQEIHNIDLTVMGAFSHNRLRELVFGSFTAKMLLNTKVPLLLLR
ncbi:universal stress protein [Reinekea marinisedimentorum]|uniref:Nucleotide-binding universal stress UspA family protein n=1 Tax=Reinekea marinisedimentorum TaxID=230495 RepID=A0A4R3I9G0_9GAMM|nr:universal stress protein [Reinekea marinisedimentorum]TCS42022.1 nucleotide-binding universal stress UspA family protein [Reinekea marinisedimentorum]